MLLRVTVLQYKGAPPQAALAYMFDERGGNIGREECNLTLPDPSRVMSRIQAQIVFADGLFNLVDQGGNPSVVNSLRVGKGKSRVLYDGDIIELCDYKLRVKTIGSAAPAKSAPPGPMRAFDPATIEELAPPILLDPDELVGNNASSFVPTFVPTFVPVSEPKPSSEVITEAVPALDPTEMLEIAFDMDVDFDNLDDNADDSSADPHATLGIDNPLEVNAVEEDLPPAGEVPNTLEQAPLRNAEHAAMLAALCKGLGIPAPQCTTTMMPQHVGIVMRRAMLSALESVLASFTPEDMEKRLADRELLNIPVPRDRGTKLWELFEQCHAEISHEAEDNFHELFGREFLKACEVQIVRLHQHN